MKTSNGNIGSIDPWSKDIGVKSRKVNGIIAERCERAIVQDRFDLYKKRLQRLIIQASFPAIE